MTERPDRDGPIFYAVGVATMACFIAVMVSHYTDKRLDALEEAAVITVCPTKAKD